MFDISFYVNNSEKNKVDKSLNHIATLSGVLKEMQLYDYIYFRQILFC